MGLLKNQIASRLNNLFLQQILGQFCPGQIDAAEASHHLQIGRAHLYRLRTRFLKERTRFAAKLSGGDHWPDWPPAAVRFLKAVPASSKATQFSTGGR
jgi:hypothetical protein